MDGSLLYNINKSIKDDKIDYVVIRLKELPDGQSFFWTNTGNVLADIDVPMLCVPIDAKFKKQKP
jgi:hypothetical protein